MAQKEVKPNSIKARLRKIKLYVGLTGRKFEEKTGMAKGSLGNRFEPSATVLSNVINEYENINPEWLLTGKGEMLKSYAMASHTDTANEPANLYSGAGALTMNINIEDFKTEIMEKLNDQVMVQQTTIAALSKVINDLQFKLEKYENS